MDRDMYNVLQIRRGATKEEIRKAYFKLALKYHPDRNASIDAKNKFQEIQSAYETLSDDEKRKDYDSGRTSNGSTNKSDMYKDHDDVYYIIGIIKSFVDKYKLNEEEKKYLFDNITTDDLEVIFTKKSSDNIRAQAVERFNRVLQKVIIRRLSRQNEFLAILLNNLDE